MLQAIPFEFRAIEGVLETVCEMYHKQVATFDEYAHSLSDNLSDKKRLYWLKRSVLEVNTQADATLNVLNEVLENDMDMVRNCFSHARLTEVALMQNFSS